MSRSNETDLLAPFEIWEVMLDNSTIKFHEPLVLTPQRMPHDPDEPGDVEYLEIVNPELNIDVFAENREELLDWVHTDIRFIWKHIVLAPDNALNRDALTIKKNWLLVAEVVNG